MPTLSPLLELEIRDFLYDNGGNWVPAEKIYRYEEFNPSHPTKDEINTALDLLCAKQIIEKSWVRNRVKYRYISMRQSRL